MPISESTASSDVEVLYALNFNLLLLMFTNERDQLESYLPGKEYQYDFMLRKGFFLPDIKSNLVTIDWMDLVFRGIVWCPK